MPLLSISPTIQINGGFGGDVLDIPLTVTEFMIPDASGFLVTATFVPEKLLWSDYGTNPLGCSLNIINHEQQALAGPINVSIQFDKTQIAYVADSMDGGGVAVQNVNFDTDSGTLTFVLPDDIAASEGAASLRFQISKPRQMP